jgi:hypothetical protein
MVKAIVRIIECPVLVMAAGLALAGNACAFAKLRPWPSFSFRQAPCPSLCGSAAC